MIASSSASRSPRKGLRLEVVAAYAILFVVLVAMATPFVWMISNSFKTNTEIFRLPPSLIPTGPTLENYRMLFHDYDFIRHFANSSIIALIHTGLHLFLASLAGFSFAKYEFRFKRVLFLFMLVSMMVPLYTIFVPLFVLVLRLGLVNSYLGVVLPGIANAFGIFFMKQNIESIPNELLDAARIDGASEFRIYARIVLPLVRPALAVLAVLAFMASWNDFVWPLIVLRSRDIQTLPVIMAGMNGAYRMEYGVIMGASFLSTLPIMVLFIALQRQFIKGLTFGAVRG